MDIRSAPRSLRSLQELIQLQQQRAQERQQAINEGLEQFVVTQEAKSKLAIRAITDPPARFEAQA